MRSRDITPEQAATIARWLAPTMTNLRKLHERMLAVGFAEDDPILRRVLDAKVATQDLRLALHDIERRPRRRTAEPIPQWIKARGRQNEPSVEERAMGDADAAARDASG